LIAAVGPDSGPAVAVQRVKAAIKSRLRAFRFWYVRQFRAFSREDLARKLRELGIVEGDVVLVHSSYDAFAGFVGKPTDVIGVLEAAVSRRGVLMMPTIPFTGTAVEHVAHTPIFDVARTPSRMGLLTELFRRSAGVVRSVHPTHAVAIWGDDAQALAAGHHTAKTPCGQGSPYAKLLERDGKVLLAGTDIASLTLYHTLEEALEDRLPASPFTSTDFRLPSRLSDGTTVVTITRLFEPAVSRRRNVAKIVPELKQRGQWHEARLGGLTLVLLRAREVRDAVFALAARGIYCYD
jgi:aminoglycoside 3-N-acetyltransferase